MRGLKGSTLKRYDRGGIMAFYETAQEIEAEQLRIEQKIEALKAFMRSDMWLTLLKEERESLWKQFRAMGKYREALLERLPMSITE